MSKDRAARKEIADRIKSLASFKGDFDKECQELVELMRIAEIPSQSTYWQEYNHAIQARTSPAKKPEYNQNKYFGRAYNTMVAVKRSPNCVWICETYADKQTHLARIRVSWGFHPHFCSTEITYLENNYPSELFITSTGKTRCVFYTPLPQEDLETICQGLSTKDCRAQANKIINFGFAVCSLIYDGLKTGNYTDVPKHPLSAVRNDSECWQAIEQNKDKTVWLKPVTFSNGKLGFEVQYTTGH